MKTYKHLVIPLEADCYSFASPAMLIRYAVSYTVMAIHDDGLPRQRLFSEIGGAWMVARLELTQYEPIEDMARLELRVSDRRVSGGKYIYTIAAVNQGVTTAECTMEFIAVEWETKKIIRPKTVEPYWDSPTAPSERRSIARVRFPGDEGDHPYELTVRASDCDSNLHLSSPVYAAYICDYIRYWDGPHQLLKTLRIEYCNEVKSGARLKLTRCDADDGIYIKCVGDDGKTAFLAFCEYTLAD